MYDALERGIQMFCMENFDLTGSTVVSEGLGEDFPSDWDDVVFD